jgi:hypothetical protein
VAPAQGPGKDRCHTARPGQQPGVDHADVGVPVALPERSIFVASAVREADRVSCMAFRVT